MSIRVLGLRSCRHFLKNIFYFKNFYYICNMYLEFLEKLIRKYNWPTWPRIDLEKKEIKDQYIIYLKQKDRYIIKVVSDKDYDDCARTLIFKVFIGGITKTNEVLKDHNLIIV